jgi:hypothetical protein
VGCVNSDPQSVGPPARRAACGRVLAAVIILVIAVAAAAGPALSAQSGGGWDVSFPQCVGSGVVALPASPVIGVVGVNFGHPFSTNPCLASQIGWAGPATQIYMNTDDPGPGTRFWPARTTPHTRTGPRRCIAVRRSTATAACAYDYGWKAARDAYVRVGAALRALGAPSAPQVPAAANAVRWWLDVEAANAWSHSAARNTASIAGSLAYLRSVHVTSVGIYANRNDSHTLFVPNSTTFPAGTLSWLATGSQTQTGGLMLCTYPGFTGSGYTSMVQFWPSSLDADAQCAGYVVGGATEIAGVPATGVHVTLVQPAPAATTITVASSASTGQFAATAAGPWTRTVTMPIAAGAVTGPAFAYRDTHTGTSTLSATAAGVAGQIARYSTVAAGPLVHLGIAPASTSATVGAGVPLTVTGSDAFGNRAALPRGPVWSVSPAIAGSVTNGPVGRAVFHPAAAVPALVTATLGGVSAHASVAIAPPAGTDPGTISGPAVVAAGAASGALAVRQWTPAGVQPVTWTVSAPAGAEVATGPSGPWQSAVTVTVAPGEILSDTFVVRDTTAGAVGLTATSSAQVIHRTIRVAAATPVVLSVQPSSTRLPLHAGETLVAVGHDRFGNSAAVSVRWSATPRGRVSLSHPAGPNVRIVAQRHGPVVVTATVGRLTASARVRVR